MGLVAYRVELGGFEDLANLRDRAKTFGCELRAGEQEEGDGDLLRVKDPTGAWLELSSRAAGDG